MYNNRMSITKINEKIKSLTERPYGKDILSFLVIAIISLGSFYLGRQSTTYINDSQVQILNAVQAGPDQIPNIANQDTGNTEPNTNYTKGNYLASSRGKKYYPVDCPAANNIKNENRVYFKTASEAEAKGYTLSGSCS